MRDITPVIKPVVDELTTHPGHDLDRTQLEDLCRLETGLLLLETTLPAAPALAGWTLFSGYPFARAWAAPRLGASAEAALRAARHALWPFQRQSAWDEALKEYRAMPAALRGYDIVSPEQPPERRRPAAAAGRWEAYRRLLRQAPPFRTRDLRPAGPGLHAFPAGRTTAHVELPVINLQAPAGHDLGAGRHGRGPVRFSYGELRATAAEMDARHPGAWVDRLDRIRWSGRTEHGFTDTTDLTVARLQHLACRERGALHTLRDIIAVHMAHKRHGRVAVIVGRESDALRLVRLYNLHAQGSAAPVLALPGRPWHIERTHREQLRRLGRNLLSAEETAFDYLSTACALNELRSEPGTNTPLSFGDAPCHGLRPVSAGTRPGEERVCPLLPACPRHRADRELVDASIWVATIPGLLEVSPHPTQNHEDVRMLELACRRSDLVLVDHADRAQQTLDRSFATARSLVGGRHEFLEDLHERRRRSPRAERRAETADRSADTWSGALDTGRITARKLHDLLEEQPALRAAVDLTCFSAHSIQRGILEDALPGPDTAPPDRRLTEQLDEFRKDPFGELRPPGSDRPHSELTALLHDLLRTGDPRNTHARLLWVTEALFASQADQGHRPDRRPHSLAARFELFLLLSALESSLGLLLDTWHRANPVVRAGFNPLVKIPFDFLPLVPEPPMGEVLGFRFVERVSGMGELSFFRCHGVGRELLTGLHGLPEADGLPATNVLLMSGTGWAGAATKTHLPVPVGVVAELRTPTPRGVMRHEPEITEEGALRLSEIPPDERTVALRRAAWALGASEAEGADAGGPLERQLMALPDGRDHLLMIVGSYDEAQIVADTLHTMGERWHGRVMRLARDDDAGSPASDTADDGARILARGDLGDFRTLNADVLVAPLNALDPRHRVLNHRGTGVFGGVYFLSCPGHFPRDPETAVSAVNSWITRATANGDFTAWTRSAATLSEGGLDLRRRAEREWERLLGRGETWGKLGEDRHAVTWDLIVAMAQVIGLAQDGGEAVDVVLVDAGFAPGRHRTPQQPDTARTSRLHSMFDVLRPYFDPAGTVDPHDRYVARALYGPLWTMLSGCLAGFTDEVPR
ncbi:pPIWI_RE_Z domain-containing protein [Streptomyces goshikiensis]|uniref:pPIWI_RE_Z domain-containing protein n=1 Tax=Streptomyces goshikiensis TaxID=1942 RepID=UPI00368EDB1C